jgi:hypothetical protein
MLIYKFNSVQCRVAVVAVIGWLTIGCAPTHFGGRLVSVTLTTRETKDAGVAYLIPNGRYMAEPDIANNPEEMTHYRKGPTPADVRILPKVWWFIVVRPDGKSSAPLSFNPDDLPDSTVFADFGNAP